jgi:hypothetical protein
MLDSYQHPPQRLLAAQQNRNNTTATRWLAATPDASVELYFDLTHWISHLIWNYAVTLRSSMDSCRKRLPLSVVEIQQ